MLQQAFLLVSLFGATANLYAQSNQHNIALLQQQVNELNERVDGLITLIEGFSTTIGQVQKNQQSLKEIDKKIESVSLECKKESEASIVNSQNTQAVKREVVYNKISTPHDANKTLGNSRSNNELYREGAQFFQKKQYDKSKKRFMLMVDKKYKPASSNYYLGEIAYYTKEYSDAIYYYKKSVKLYDKASYMDTLMLHIAISLQQIGENAQAKIFYQTIVNDYPEKKSASIARNNLKKI